jgi:hypothetical protein
MSATDDNIRVALKRLNDAQPLIFEAVSVLRSMGYTTPSANLKTVLDDLITETLAAEYAVSTETLG